MKGSSWRRYQGPTGHCPVGGDTRDRRCSLLSIRSPEDTFPGVWVLSKGYGVSIIVGKRRLTAFSLNSGQRPYLSFRVTEGQPYNSKCIRDVCREPSASPEQQWRDSYPSGTAHGFFKLEGSSADPGDFDAPWGRFLWSNSFTLLGPSPSARWELLVHTWGTFLFHPQLGTGGFLSFFGTRRWVLPHRGLRTGNRFLGIPLLRCSSHPDGCCPRRSVSSSGVLQPGRMVLPPEVVGPPAKQEAQLHPPGLRAERLQTDGPGAPARPAA